MNTLTVNQKMLIAGLVGFVVGAGAVWLINVTQKNTSSDDHAEETAAEQTEVANQAAAATAVQTPVVVVSDEEVSVFATNQPAGMVVRANVVLNNPGWVAVQEDLNGTRGNILGAAWLPAGQASIDVELLRATVPGNLYHVLLYTDDGDKAFELDQDARITGSEDTSVEVLFQATQP